MTGRASFTIWCHDPDLAKAGQSIGKHAKTPRVNAIVIGDQDVHE
jgi:hypothetical protein